MDNIDVDMRPASKVPRPASHVPHVPHVLDVPRPTPRATQQAILTSSDASEAWPASLSCWIFLTLVMSSLLGYVRPFAVQPDG